MMQGRCRRGFGLLVLTGVALGGCSSGGVGNPSDHSGQVHAAPKGAFSDQRVATSSLREEAIALLTDSTNSPIAQERANALEGLIPAPARLQPLAAKAMTDENVGVRSVALMAVGEAKLEKLAPQMRPLLSDPSPYVRGAAIYGLSACGEKVNPTELATMLLTDDDVRIRSQAAFLLGEMGNESAISMLLEAGSMKLPRATESERRLFQLQIAEAMIKLGDNSQLDVLRSSLYPSRPEELEATALAVQILGEVGDRGSIDALIHLETYTNNRGERMPAEIRLAIAAALAKLGLPQGGFVAMQFVDSERASIRAQAAYTLGRTSDTQHLDKLHELMQDESGIVRVSAAAGVLQVLGSTASVR